MNLKDYWLLALIMVICPINGILIERDMILVGILLNMCHLPFLLGYISDKNKEK